MTTPTFAIATDGKAHATATVLRGLLRDHEGRHVVTYTLLDELVIRGNTALAGMSHAWPVMRAALQGLAAALQFPFPHLTTPASDPEAPYRSLLATLEVDQALDLAGELAVYLDAITPHSQRMSLPGTHVFLERNIEALRQLSVFNQVRYMDRQALEAFAIEHMFQARRIQHELENLRDRIRALVDHPSA